LQIRAGPSAVRAAPQRSQTARISSAIVGTPSSVSLEGLQRLGNLILAAAVGHLPLPCLLERGHCLLPPQLTEPPGRHHPHRAVRPLQPLSVDSHHVQGLLPVLLLEPLRRGPASLARA